MIPALENFREAMNKGGGNISLVAKAFGVSRGTVYSWMKEPEYKQVLDDARGSFFDEVLSTSRHVALGIPDIQNGKLIGWIVPPDSGMLRYLLGTLGRNEGFGERLDITTNGKEIGKGMTPKEAEDFLSRLESEY